MRGSRDTGIGSIETPTGVGWTVDGVTLADVSLGVDR